VLRLILHGVEGRGKASGRGKKSFLSGPTLLQVPEGCQRERQARGVGFWEVLGCNQQTPGSCITVQQRVADQIYVTFSTDVNAIQNETIEVQYQVTPRVTFSGTRNQNGGFGFDTRITKTW